MLWLEVLVVNYLQVNDLVLSITHGATNITWTSSHSPCLLMGCSEFDGPIYIYIYIYIYIIYYTLVLGTSYTICLYKGGLHNKTTYVQIIVLASLDISFSTSKCRPRPAKGSQPVVCVQETKTLHAQHKQNIMRFTCVFHKTLTVNIYSKHSQQLCSWHDNPIQSSKGNSLDPWLEMLWLEVLLVNYLPTSAWLSLVHYTWCYRQYTNK